MKVLFLDIDGVFNSHAWLAAGHMKGDPTKASHINPKQLSLINEVVRVTGCKVVLSSSWRLLYGVEFTQRALDANGATFKLLDKTPDCAQKVGSLFLAHERGAEIQAWLDEHPEVTAFAIVDDSSDMGPLRKHLVRTTWAQGLTQGHADWLIDMLGERDGTAADEPASV